MSAITEKDIEDIITRHGNLITKLDNFKQGKTKVEAVLDSRKQSLKKVMDETVKAGFDPNKIREELQRAVEVVTLKIEVLATELEEGEVQLRPMLKEIQGAS